MKIFYIYCYKYVIIIYSFIYVLKFLAPLHIELNNVFNIILLKELHN